MNKDYSKLNAIMAKADPSSALIDDYKSIDTTEWIGTGNYIFNAHISGSIFGGAANNRITTFTGRPKTGKSYLIINIMKNAQDMGYYTWLFETENSADVKRMKKHMLNPDATRLSQPLTVEDITEQIVQFIEDYKKIPADSRPKVAIFIDSLNGLNSRKQYNDAASGNLKSDMGAIAKSMNAFFRMVSVPLGKLGVPIIESGHTYEKEIAGTPARKEVPSVQGNGPIYFSSVVTMLKRRIEKEKDRQENAAGVKDREAKGVLVTSSIYESRFTRHVPVTFYISFLKGMNPYLGLQNFIGWQICGVDSGKWAPYVDLAYEFLQKKVVSTPEDLVGFTFGKKELRSMLSKVKTSQMDDAIRSNMEDGFLETDGDGTWFFNKSVLDRLVDGEYPKPNNEMAVLNPNSPGYIAKHSPGRTFSKVELFSKLVFTQEVLEQIDEHIKPIFELPQQGMDDPDTIAEEGTTIFD